MSREFFKKDEVLAFRSRWQKFEINAFFHKKSQGLAPFAEHTAKKGLGVSAFKRDARERDRTAFQGVCRGAVFEAFFVARGEEKRDPALFASRKQRKH